METFFIYLLKVNVALVVFYLLYVIFFRKDTFIAVRRYFFLSAVLFSLTYPLFVVEKLSQFTLIPQHEQTVETTVLFNEAEMKMLPETNALSAPSINWINVISFIFAGGTIFFAMRFMWQLMSIFHIRAKSEKRMVLCFPVFHLSGEITPFSFFKWIFINTETYSDEEFSQILLHEQTHAAQWHSIDVILMELVCMAFWWNPVVWMMRREMAINLEFLADNNVLRHGVNSREYQYHLLRLTYHETAVQIVNNFNVSQLKQRIMMMNTTKSPGQKLAKYLLVLPLTFLLITANSCMNNQKKSEESADAETEELQAPFSDSGIEIDVAENYVPPITDKDEGIFSVVESMPEFPGGNGAMMKFLSDNIKYPVKAQEDNTQGRVIANFVVEKDGSLSDFQVVRGIDPLLDDEAIRVLKTMPNWTPGKQRGENVRVRFTLPVVFRLQGGSGKGAGSIPPPPPPPPADAKKSGSVPPPPPRPESMKSKEELRNSNEIFVVVDQQPEFPNGNTVLMKWLSDNVVYPKVAIENGIQGRVITNFVVEKDGRITDVQVVRGIDPALDKEALRVIESMPKWKPGKLNGENVRTRFTLPVVFRLQE